MSESRRTEMERAAQRNEVKSLREKDGEIFDGLVERCGGATEAERLLLNSGLSRALLRRAYATLCSGDAGTLYELLRTQEVRLGFSIKDALLRETKHAVKGCLRKAVPRNISSGPLSSKEAYLAELSGTSHISTWIVGLLDKAEEGNYTYLLHSECIQGLRLARLFMVCGQSIDSVKNALRAGMAYAVLDGFSKGLEVFGYGSTVDDIWAVEEVLEHVYSTRGRDAANGALSSGVLLEELSYAYTEVYAFDAEKTYLAICAGNLHGLVDSDARSKISKMSNGDELTEAMLTRLYEEYGIRTVGMAFMSKLDLRALVADYGAPNRMYSLYRKLEDSLPKERDH